MSTALAFFVAFLVAGAVAWSVRRHEQQREPKATDCSRAIDEIFAKISGDTADATLLTRLLVHRDKCMGDVAYVDQLSRLMVNVQKFPEARTLLEDAERQHTFKPDELQAQVAMVDLGEAQLAWTNGDVPRAQALHTSAVTSLNALRERWPEWALPYRELDEARSASYLADQQRDEMNYSILQEKARSRWVNGAFARDLEGWTLMVFVFGCTAIATLGLFACISGVLSAREFASTNVYPVASAPHGFVAMNGTLQLLPNTSAVLGPYSQKPGVYYEISEHTGVRRNVIKYGRSTQLFALHDASGDIVIDPARASVYSSHFETSRNTAIGRLSNMREDEYMLFANDTAYVVGEVSEVSVGGATRRELHAPIDGRTYVISNFSQAQLMGMQQAWKWAGIFAFVVSVLVLGFSCYERYGVNAVPGTLL